MKQPVKRYQIKITNFVGRTGVWYADKIGNTYTATRELVPVERFKVSDLLFVHPGNCEIISEDVHELKQHVSKRKYVSDERKAEIVHLINKDTNRKVIQKRYGLSAEHIRKIWKEYLEENR